MKISKKTPKKEIPAAVCMNATDATALTIQALLTNDDKLLFNILAAIEYAAGRGRGEIWLETGIALFHPYTPVTLDALRTLGYSVTKTKSRFITYGTCVVRWHPSVNSKDKI